MKNLSIIKKKTVLSKWAYCSKLTTAGAKEIGIGAYSTVYTVPGNRKIVRKVMLHDTGYLTYLKHVIKNQDNPFFPKIFSVTKFSAPKGAVFYVIEMERLSKKYYRARIISDRFMDVFVYEKRGKYKKKNEKIHGITHLFGIKDQEIKVHIPKMVFVLTRIFNTCSPDIHCGNFMFRKNQVVIIDPVVG